MNIPGRASWATALSGLPLRVSFEAWFSCIHDVWQGIESYWPYIITFMGTTSLKVIMQDSKEDMYIHRTHNQEYVAYETKLTAWLTHMYCTVKNVTDSVWPCMWSYSDHTIHVITLYDHMQLVMTCQVRPDNCESQSVKMQRLSRLSAGSVGACASKLPNASNVRLFQVCTSDYVGNRRSRKELQPIFHETLTFAMQADRSMSPRWRLSSVPLYGIGWDTHESWGKLTNSTLLCEVEGLMPSTGISASQYGR